MKTDPMELNDLSLNPEYAAKIKELRTELLKLSTQLSDPIDYNDPVESRKKAAPKKLSAH